jgi:hypothetical protein
MYLAGHIVRLCGTMMKYIDRATGGLRRRYRVDELNLVPISHLAQSIIQHGVTFPMRHGDSEVPAC